LDFSPEEDFLNRFKSYFYNALECVRFGKGDLVEAAGVEPASETTKDKEHSCFSAFIFVS